MERQHTHSAGGTTLAAKRKLFGYKPTNEVYGVAFEGERIVEAVGPLTTAQQRDWITFVAPAADVGWIERNLDDFDELDPADL